MAQDRITHLEGEAQTAIDESVVPRGETAYRVTELEAIVAEAREEVAELQDVANRADQKLRNLEKDQELEMLRGKERVRNEFKEAHDQDIRAKDDLIQLLKAKVESLERNARGHITEAPGAATVPVSRDDAYALGGGSPREEDSVSQMREHPADKDGVSPSQSMDSSGTACRLRLPPLPKFSCEDRDDADAMARWLRKLDRHAEIKKWSTRERLLQFEMHLAGRAVARGGQKEL